MMIEMIGRNATRINQLVSDLLNSTRFTQLNYTLADINEVLDQTLKLAHDRIELNKVTVKKDYEKNMGELCIDEERIKLAFLNIIVNAIEAIEKGTGVLKIKTNKREANVLLRSMIMDPEWIKKRSEIFLNLILPRNQKEMVLGLTNTQNIILNHEGKIRCD